MSTNAVSDSAVAHDHFSATHFWHRTIDLCTYLGRIDIPEVVAPSETLGRTMRREDERHKVREYGNGVDAHGLRDGNVTVL